MKKKSGARSKEQGEERAYTGASAGEQEVRAGECDTGVIIIFPIFRS
jgi:hypothetical protein